jgi:hypothetical protein
VTFSVYLPFTATTKAIFCGFAFEMQEQSIELVLELDREDEKIEQSDKQRPGMPLFKRQIRVWTKETVVRN